MRRQSIRSGSAADQRKLALAGFRPAKQRPGAVQQARDPTFKRKAPTSVPGCVAAKRAALVGPNSTATPEPPSCLHEQSQGTPGTKGEQGLLAGSATSGLNLEWVPQNRGITLHPPLEQFLSLSSQRTILMLSARSTSTLCPSVEAPAPNLARRASSCSVKNCPALASHVSAGTEVPPVRTGSPMASTQLCVSNQGKVSQSGNAAARMEPSLAKQAYLGPAECGYPLVSKGLGFEALPCPQTGDGRGSLVQGQRGTAGLHGPSIGEAGGVVPREQSREPTPVVASTSAGGPVSRDPSPESMAQVSCTPPHAVQLEPAPARAQAGPPQPSVLPAVLPAVPPLKFTRAPLPRLDQLKRACSSAGAASTQSSSQPLNGAAKTPTPGPLAGRTAHIPAALPSLVPASAGTNTEACALEASVCTADAAEAVPMCAGSTALPEAEFGDEMQADATDVAVRREDVHRESMFPSRQSDAEESEAPEFVPLPDGGVAHQRPSQEGSGASGARSTGPLGYSLGGDLKEADVSCGLRQLPPLVPLPVACVSPVAQRAVRPVLGLAAAAGDREGVSGTAGDRVPTGEGEMGRRGYQREPRGDSVGPQRLCDPDQVGQPWVPPWAGGLSGKAEALAAALMSTAPGGPGPLDEPSVVAKATGPPRPEHPSQTGRGCEVPGGTGGTTVLHTPSASSERRLGPGSTGGTAVLHVPVGSSERAWVQRGGGEVRPYPAISGDMQQARAVHGSPCGDQDHRLPAQSCPGSLSSSAVLTAVHMPSQSVSGHVPSKTVPRLPIAKRAPCVPPLPVGAPPRARVPLMTGSSTAQNASLEPGMEAGSVPRANPAAHVPHVPPASTCVPQASTSAGGVAPHGSRAFAGPQSTAAGYTQAHVGDWLSPGDPGARDGAPAGGVLGRVTKKASDAWLEPWRDLIRAEAAGELIRVPQPRAPVALNPGKPAPGRSESGVEAATGPPAPVTPLLNKDGQLYLEPEGPAEVPPRSRAHPEVTAESPGGTAAPGPPSLPQFQAASSGHAHGPTSSVPGDLGPRQQHTVTTPALPRDAGPPREHGVERTAETSHVTSHLQLSHNTHAGAVPRSEERFAGSRSRVRGSLDFDAPNCGPRDLSGTCKYVYGPHSASAGGQGAAAVHGRTSTARTAAQQEDQCGSGVAVTEVGTRQSVYGFRQGSGTPGDADLEITSPRRDGVGQAGGPRGGPCDQGTRKRAALPAEPDENPPKRQNLGRTLAEDALGSGGPDRHPSCTAPTRHPVALPLMAHTPAPPTSLKPSLSAHMDALRPTKLPESKAPLLPLAKPLAPGGPIAAVQAQGHPGTGAASGSHNPAGGGAGGRSGKGQCTGVPHGKVQRTGVPQGKARPTGVPRGVCKFWRFGKCGKGSSCTFRHEGKPVSLLLRCRANKSGRCLKGTACMFSHDPDHVDPCKKLFRNGWCNRGHACPYSHEALQDGMADALVAFWGEQERLEKEYGKKKRVRPPKQNAAVKSGGADARDRGHVSEDGSLSSDDD